MPRIVVKSSGKVYESAPQEWIDENFAPDEYIVDASPVIDLPPEPTHKTVFSPWELYCSFSANEILLAKAHSDPAIVLQAALLAEGRDVVINSADAGYQSTVDQFETAGVITADRAVEYRQGLPRRNT